MQRSSEWLQHCCTNWSSLYLLVFSGFHRAFLKSITFYWPTNALNCIKLRHTHHRYKKSRCQTPTTHTKISQVISVKHVQHYLMMDRKRSETCRS